MIKEEKVTWQPELETDFRLSICLESAQQLTRSLLIRNSCLQILMMGSRQAVIPGMRICAAEDHYQAGMGTYVLHGYIYASLVGHLRLVSNDKTAAAADKNDMITVEVEPR